jgi:NADPH:quinone reductase-like Zn-dependent oxidoreductase
VLVKVYATTVSAADYRVRSFLVPRSYWLLARLALGFFKPRKKILGTELAGDVESVGKDVTRIKPGDPVFAYTGHDLGAYVEYRCLREDGMLAIKPDNVSYDEAAAISFGGLAALHFINKANIQHGQKVLIYGASGAVGTYAVQLAKHFGAEVTGVCGTNNLEMVKSLGADKVIDYTTTDFSSTGETYDVVFDVVGKSSFSACMRVLKNGGTYLQAVAAPALGLRMLWASMTSNKRFIGGTANPKLENLMFLKELVEKGKIKPVIDRHYPLEEIVEAHRYADTGHKRGSLVITVAQHD